MSLEGRTVAGVGVNDLEEHMSVGTQACTSNILAPVVFVLILTSSQSFRPIMRLPDRGRQPYKGISRRLVVSIDIGTTFTAASFCILQPGTPPKFEEVRAFIRRHLNR